MVDLNERLGRGFRLVRKFRQIRWSLTPVIPVAEAMRISNQFED